MAWTLVAGCTAETSSPPADAHARWWAHVQRLASDDMRGRETGSAEHRHAAEYVAEAFKAAGLAPAGTDGYRQPVTFRSRRIDEVQSSLALVRDGTRTPVTLGEEATFGMRIDAAPDVEAPLVFAGHGLQIPEAQHDDFAGLDVKGKVVVYLSGSPRAIPGALSAHYQSAAERWATLKRLGAIGTIAIPNPKSTDVPWERSAPNRLNPAMAIADSAYDDTAGQEVSITFNPAHADRLFAGSGHSFADILPAADTGGALPRFALRTSLQAKVAVATEELQSDNVAGVVRGTDPAAGSGAQLRAAHRHFILGLMAGWARKPALALGFVHVEAGPLVRSLYHSHEQADAYQNARGLDSLRS